MAPETSRTPEPVTSAWATLLLILLVLVFGLTLFVVSARIWLPADMAVPAYVN